MRLMKFAACPLVVITTACASSIPVNNPAPETAQVQASVRAPSRWSATLNPVQERTGDVRQTSTNRARGSFSMVPGEAPGWSRVNLSFSANEAGSGSTTAAWALLPGACGSAEAPVLPLNAFPILSLSGGGSAQITTQIHYVFPMSGTYHVNVYRAGNVMTTDSWSLANVLACGNLRYQE